ncbi:putative cell wall proline rich protein [Erysiphe neolycopersici]|uniref:Putative cell wall proline rich protein n=1 Tax=Erysiphe neolycopersici TaxID=212602 RepID=A0A420HSX4_9PEZI|nr:putative cell wall proline rich protein [Erysiphe neolycopersici]
MMSVQAPFRPLCNLSLPTRESDLTSTRYNSSAIDIISHNIASDITISGPLALPRFVFPAKPSHIVPTPQLSPSIGYTQSKNLSLNIRADDSLYSQDKLSSESSHSSPTRSCESPPVSPRTALPRSGFHKRGTSEFIGVEKSTSTASMSMRTSSKVDITSTSHLGGSIVQRRGHAHRRSAAISSGDLSIVLRPQIIPKTGGSLPNSPNVDHESSKFLRSLPSGTLKVEIDQFTQNKEMYPLIKSPKNARVGFSDDVQIIPRPLSMASSDSASTIRLNHSLSNSISSIVSASVCSSLKRDHCHIEPTELSRPRTAEPTLENTQTKSGSHCPKRSGSLPSLIVPVTEPLADNSTPRSLKRWTFFGNEISSGGITTKLRPSSAASSWCDQNGVENTNYTIDDKSKVQINQNQGIVVVRRNSNYKKSINKQKRVKSWAGSILSNKTKQRSYKQKLRLNSPSLPKLITSSFNVETEEFARTTPTSTILLNETDYANWKPREYQPQDEAISPVIDLDAALGPFNTPISSYEDFWECSQRNGNRKRAMHSANGLSGFSGPGMHYHRRTESAPEFENVRFGLHRLGSSSKMTMEDVFEEDEDEDEDGDWEDTKTNKIDVEHRRISIEDEDDSELKVGTGIDKSVGLLQTCIDSTEQGIVTNNECYLDKTDHLEESADNILARQSISEIVIFPEKTPVCNEINDKRMSKRQSPATLSAFPALANPEEDEISSNGVSSASLQLLSPTGDNSYSLIQTPLPSPASPFSYNASITSTTQSSVLNEHELESLLLGGPGPEMRISVDDVPSLMSSDSISGESTTTGENLFQNPTIEERFRDGQRSASFSNTIVNRKRSSIKSLSRLINSSHGERNKQAIETHTSSYLEEDSQQKVGNLGKRISCIIKFWKKTDSP